MPFHLSLLTPVHKMGIPFHAFVDCGFSDGIGSVAVIEAVGRAVEVADTIFFPEENLELFGLLHFDGVESDSTNFNSFLYGTIHEVHCLRETGVEDIVVQVGETAGSESERDSFPVSFLISNVAAPLAGFTFVAPHPVAYFPDRFDNFALDEDGVVGPV